jgi:hypothetical protein
MEGFLRFQKGHLIFYYRFRQRRNLVVDNRRVKTCSRVHPEHGEGKAGSVSIKSLGAETDTGLLAFTVLCIR